MVHALLHYSYGDLQLLAQLVNTRSHLSIIIMNVHTQAN